MHGGAAEGERAANGERAERGSGLRASRLERETIGRVESAGTSGNFSASFRGALPGAPGVVAAGAASARASGSGETTFDSRGAGVVDLPVALASRTSRDGARGAGRRAEGSSARAASSGAGSGAMATVEMRLRIVVVFAIYAATYALPALQPYMVRSYQGRPHGFYSNLLLWMSNMQFVADPLGRTFFAFAPRVTARACCVLRVLRVACAPARGVSSSRILFSHVACAAYSPRSTRPPADTASLLVQLCIVSVIFVVLALTALVGSSSTVGALLADMTGYWPYAPFCALYFIYYFTRGFFITAMYTSLQVSVEAGKMTSEEAEDASKWMGSFGQIGSFLSTMGIFVLIHAGVISDS